MQGWDAGMGRLRPDPITHPRQERLLHRSLPSIQEQRYDLCCRGSGETLPRPAVCSSGGKPEKGGGEMGAQREMPESEQSSAHVTSLGMSGRGKDRGSLATVS